VAFAVGHRVQAASKPASVKDAAQGSCPVPLHDRFVITRSVPG